MSKPDVAGLANHGLTVPLQVADTRCSVRQGTPDRGKGTIPPASIQTACFESSFSLYQRVTGAHERRLP